MKYTIHYKGLTGICPKCGGQLRTCKSDDIILNCIDCNTFFKAIDSDYAESALVFEEVVIYYSDKHIQEKLEKEGKNDNT